MIETYSMTINIEANTMLSMAKRQILPAASAFAGQIAGDIGAVAASGLDCAAQKTLLKKLCSLVDSLSKSIDVLQAAADAAKAIDDTNKQANAYKDSVIPAMEALRVPADELETVVDADQWPLPTYAEMLFLK